MKKRQKVEDPPFAETASFSRLSLFEGLPSLRLQQVQAKSKVREVAAGHVFFKTGEGGEGLFLLEAGAVQTFRPSGTKKLIVAELKPPAVFGEMGCIGECRYHCFAQAIETSRVWIIPRVQVDRLRSFCSREQNPRYVAKPVLWRSDQMTICWVGDHPSKTEAFIVGGSSY